MMMEPVIRTDNVVLLERQRIRVGPASGYLYGEALDGRLLETLVAGMESRELLGELGGLEIKPGRVFRVGALLVKFFGPGRFRDYLRPSTALRVAELHWKLFPVRTPRPHYALELRSGYHVKASLLITEFVEGLVLRKAWWSVPAAREMLGPYLVDLHCRGIFHGDFQDQSQI